MRKADTGVATTGARNDRETQAHMRLLKEKAPEVADIIDNILGILQERNNRAGVGVEYEFYMHEMISNKNPLRNDEELNQISLYAWGRCSTRLRSSRGSYRSRIIRY